MDLKLVKFLDLVGQYKSIKDEIDGVIHEVLDKGSFIGGSYVSTFEAAFLSYQQARYCIGVGNGTDAIEIAIEALELPFGSEIIVPANSFIASSEAITRMGHKVVFCDCDLETYTISIEDIQKKITSETSAILAVHLYGHPCNMDALLALSSKYGLRLIEDCAQSHGAEYHGKRVGAIGDVGTFSFYPGKNLGAYGDGGAVLTNDSAIATRIRMIANHGRVQKYNHVFEGRNSRLDSIQAAILTVKLKYLDDWTEKRIHAAELYRKYLKSVASEIVLPSIADTVRHVYHLFVIRTDRREELAEFLASQGISTGVHYPIALPKLKAYDYLGKVDRSMLANQIDCTLLSLPIGDHMTKNDIKFVSKMIVKFFRNKKK